MGGTERFILNFVKVFGKDHSLELAYYKDFDEKLINCFEDLECKTIALPYYVKHPLLFLKELYYCYKAGDYDLVYIHANSSLSVLYSFPVWFTKTKTRVMYHSHNTSGGNKLLQALGTMILNRVCYKQFACSEEASRFMYGHREAHIINNVIDIADYVPNSITRDSIRNELGICNEIVIGHIGRFNKQKNHLFLIDIFKEFLFISPNSRLLLIGEGETKSEVIEKITEYGIEDKVVMLEPTERAKDYYQGMDLFLLPSLYEGLPFVGIEAQASGTPCLMADTIPNNIKITPIVYFQSLNDSPSVWASKICDIISLTKNKSDYSDLIESAGYGLQHMITDYSKSGVGLTIEQ